MSISIVKRKLGKDGPEVPRVGLGLMGNSGIYGLPAPDDVRLKFLSEAFELGQTFWDTADEYGDSEDLLGKWFAANSEKREKIFLSTKFAIRMNPANPRDFRVDSSPEYAREALEKSLKRLGLPSVDLYYVHRLDKITPIEKTIEALVEMKDQGKFKYIGLSECSADSLRRAHAVHPITAVQMEYSPFCLDIESPQTNLLKTARELGVAVVAYSPLGNGILGGEISNTNMKEGDQRVHLPMWNEENFPKNLAVVEKIKDMANTKGASSGQMTLAWLLAQGDDIFPIPGTTKASRVKENLGSISIKLSSDEEKSIRAMREEVVGGRFQASTGYSFADTPAL